MIIPPIPENEEQRVQALHSLHILDTKNEERFDRITRLAKKLFSVPIAVVSLVDKDRQWFKSIQGLDATETSREVSFCGHTILQDHVMIVENALQDARFMDNPLVLGDPDIRFYLGYPLKIRHAYNVGTLCLIDRIQRQFSDDELVTMQDLASMVEAELESMHASTTDELTGISNRRGFTSIGEHVLNLCQRYKKEVYLLFFDLDGFKAINDSFGHHEGDKVLKKFSQMLLENFRHSDVVARLGGDEFCVLISGTSEERIPEMTQRLQDKLALDRNDYDIGFSVGYVQYNCATHASMSQFINDADQKMYECKKSRKQR